MLVLALSGDVRGWIVDTLFYAWVPAPLWVIALVFTFLPVHPPVLSEHTKRNHPSGLGLALDE